MIVVDTSVIAALFIGGSESAAAARAVKADPVWMAPLLWRSEFFNVLAKHVQHRGMPLDLAVECWNDAARFVAGREHEPPRAAVLGLAAATGCTAYDCEFVALAKAADVKLVTTDRQVLAAFPGVAVPLQSFHSRASHDER